MKNKFKRISISIIALIFSVITMLSITGCGPTPSISGSVTPDNNITTPDNDTEASDNNETVPDNEVIAPDNNVTVPDNDVTAPDNDVTAPDNNVTEPDNNTTNPVVPPSDVDTEQGTDNEGTTEPGEETEEEGSSSVTPIENLTVSGTTVYINSADGLLEFNSGAGIYFGETYTIKLTCDVDMSGKEWAPASEKFKGVFDGQNHTIANLSMTAGSGRWGLFGTVDYGAQVQNLTMKNCTIINAQEYAGIICGYLEGANGKEYNIRNCSILNCSITYDCSEAVTADISTYIGAIAGFSYASIIKNSYVQNFNICAKYLPSNFDRKGKATLYFGGVVGKLQTATIDTCAVSANITANGSGDCYIGGIVGKMLDSSTINKCYYSGTINAGQIGYGSSYGSTNSASAGGICGNLVSGTISNCYNLGAINAYAKTISGFKNETLSTACSYNVYKYKFFGWKYDALTLTKVAHGYSYQNTFIGGIAGRFESGRMYYCYNAGSIQDKKYTKTFTIGYEIYSNGETMCSVVGQKVTTIINYFNSGALAGYYNSNCSFSAPGSYGGSCYVYETFKSEFAENQISKNVNYISERGAEIDVGITVRNLSVNSSLILIKSDSNEYKIHYNTLHEYCNRYSPFANNIANIVNANSSVWAVDENINGGKPYIKDLCLDD